ncbi:hypothetical protein [Arthrobacter sp. NPDC090010]|uniref:hypothetical protein n=1 Tax=Arthrobacter sp. NPDC090010 TaxID=3363942 RepID=UPI00382A3FDF
MAKKKRNAVRTGAAAQAEQALRAKVRRAVDVVMPAFVEWFETNEEPVGLWNAAAVLDVVQDLVFTSAEATGQVSVTAFVPESFVAAYDVLATSVDGKQELTDFLGAAMHCYLDFLENTGTWDGDPADLAVLQG